MCLLRVGTLTLTMRSKPSPQRNHKVPNSSKFIVRVKLKHDTSTVTGNGQAMPGNIYHALKCAQNACKHETSYYIYI